MVRFILRSFILSLLLTSFISNAQITNTFNSLKNKLPFGTSYPDTLIFKHPQSVSTCKNGKADFHVTPHEDVQTLQWETSIDNGKSWQIVKDVAGIKGSHTANLSIVHTTDNQNKSLFRCLAKIDTLSIASQSALLTFKKDLPVNAGEDMEICLGTKVKLSASGANSYTWDHHIKDHIPFTPSGTATYTVIGKDKHGCSGTDNVTVKVNPLPQVHAGEDQYVCEHSEVTLKGTGTKTYTWSHNAQDNTPIKIDAPTTFTVTGTDAKGCQNTDQVKVNTYPLPQVDLGPTLSICVGNQAHLKVHSADVSHFNWDHNLGHGHGHHVSPTTTTTYKVNVVSRHKCKNSDSIKVIVHKLPNVDAGDDLTICSGDKVTLKPSGADVYYWNHGLGLGKSHVVQPHPHVHSFMHAHTQAHTVYTVMGKDEFGCRNKDQVTITVNVIPHVHAGHDQTVCSGEYVVLSGSGADSYTWNHEIENDTPFKADVTTTYTVTGTDHNGCQDTDEVKVNALNKFKCHELGTASGH